MTTANATYDAQFFDAQTREARAVDASHSRQFARVTGITYLAIALFGGFAIGYVPSVIIDGANPAGTVKNIQENMALYKFGIGADALVMVLEIIASTMLFFMFKPVSAVAAAGATIARLLMVATMAAMLFFHAGILALIDPNMATQTMHEPSRLALIETFLSMHHAGVWIWQIFFFAHLSILGRLVLWSGRFPRIIGYGLMIGAFGYLLDSLYAFAFPDADWLGWTRVGFLVIVTLAEVSFALYLAIKAPAAPAASAQ